MTSKKQFSRVHAVCRYLRDKPCAQCPASEPSPYGRIVKSCRLKAMEVVNIVRHGLPWKPPHNSRQKAWRKRWNRE